MYKTIFIKAVQQETYISKFEDKKRDIIKYEVDGSKLSKEMTKILNELEEDGYKLESIIPINSIHSSIEYWGEGGGGYGGSFTDGVIITAKKYE